MAAALLGVKCDSCGEQATHRRRFVNFEYGELEYIPFCDECDPPKGATDGGQQSIRN